MDLDALRVALADVDKLPTGATFEANGETVSKAVDGDKVVYVTRTARKRGDFYRTPPECIEALLPKLELPEGAFILDAGSGDGAISSVLSKACPGAEIVGVERDPELVERSRERDLYNAEFVQGNFYKYTSALHGPDLVIMNPPFSFAREFVERALAIVKRGGTVCALLRLGFLSSETRREFNRRHPADVYVLTRRPSFTGGGSDATDYAWFVWGPGRGHRWETITPEKKRRARKTKAPEKTKRRASEGRAPRTETPDAVRALPLPEVPTIVQ